MCSKSYCPLFLWIPAGAGTTGALILTGNVSGIIHFQIPTSVPHTISRYTLEGLNKMV